ncbi:MAG: hypothetical protein JXQ71_08785 [Verrucomicrobia bacterium]|nr:hypothetical protein [Verrucomicrobiota bacterium]
MNYHLAYALYRVGRFADTGGPLEALLRLAPQHAKGNYLMALSLAEQARIPDALQYHQKAVDSSGPMALLPDFHDALSKCYQRQGLFQDALDAAREARQLALQAGRDNHAAELQHRIDQCRARLQARRP